MCRFNWQDVVFWLKVKKGIENLGSCDHQMEAIVALMWSGCAQKVLVYIEDI